MPNSCHAKKSSKTKMGLRKTPLSYIMKTRKAVPPWKALGKGKRKISHLNMLFGYRDGKMEGEEAAARCLDSYKERKVFSRKSGSLREGPPNK